MLATPSITKHVSSSAYNVHSEIVCIINLVPTRQSYTKRALSFFHLRNHSGINYILFSVPLVVAGLAEPKPSL